MRSSDDYPCIDKATFLSLPKELRLSIYSYVLPNTESFDLRFQRGDGEAKPPSEYNLTFVREANDSNGVWRMQKTLPRSDREVGNEIVWRLGCISLLSTCHEIHDECVDMIYGDNTFVIDVSFDTIKFRQRWHTANNLTPGRSYAFLDHFSQRNLMKIKNYIVNVEHVDDYTGMIKFNCGGRGLTAGIRGRVQELVDLLVAVPNLHRLHVHLIDGAISRVRFPSGRVHRVQDVQNFSTSQTVLDPFKGLYGVRKARVTGVSEAYAKLLEVSMAETRGAPQG
ncbi:hypothetical protein DPSP01_006365 [Paraphaeosphaeria sporulosa]|uniref:DUF7730 domain-containing protein n=1 Tax=Paraphaeosphaeria sporulosa TaxID=1460663 RepID=A0A177CDG7_9PLEO|nr:uncharacterized protein CC84DRAFT_1164152 [Paraphaeosphaeria sporulosa]OAG05685.1 hypothetical protein CC84DRAFT_1164152 [Paraphaeosphaeria sporulosa]